MSSALIKVVPLTILAILGDNPGRVDLPTGAQAHGVRQGWVSQDGQFRLVGVRAFITPGGQVIVGPASYSFSGGDVVETFPTVPVSPNTILKATTILSRLNNVEYVALVSTLSPNTGVSRWLDAMRINGQIDMADSAHQAMKAQLVSIGILINTARANVVFDTTNGQ